MRWNRRQDLTTTVNDMDPRDASQAELMRTGHQTAAHNRWLAAEIQDALDDPRPGLSFDEVMVALDSEIGAAERERRRSLSRGTACPFQRSATAMNDGKLFAW